MGLFVSKQLVQRYGGTLNFVSESSGPNIGTTFILTFQLDVYESSEGESNAQDNVNLDEINLDIEKTS